MMIKHILIVNNEPSLLVSVSMSLLQAGHVVTVATTGDEAFRKIKQRRIANSRFDLLILDTQIMDLSGIGWLEIIREYNGKMPVLFISGNTDHHLGSLIAQKNQTAFLNKPFGSRQLVQSVEAMMGP